MKTVLAITLTLYLSPAFACGDAAFGPDYSAGTCPVAPEPAVSERIPLVGHDRPIWLGTRADGTNRGIAIVTGYIVDDFAVLVADLPHGLKVAGISSQCIANYCPQLGEWARQDLSAKVDALARDWYLRGE